MYIEIMVGNYSARPKGLRLVRGGLSHSSEKLGTMRQAAKL